jgi:hypothetical protein
MSDSIEVQINNTAWIQVVSTGTGYFTNESDNIIKYKEAASQPLASNQIGHTLQRRADKRYELAPGLSVWARTVFPELAIDVSAIVLVTPDL